MIARQESGPILAFGCPQMRTPQISKNILCTKSKPVKQTHNFELWTQQPLLKANWSPPVLQPVVDKQQQCLFAELQLQHPYSPKKWFVRDCDIAWQQPHFMNVDELYMPSGPQHNALQVFMVDIV
jgi:hypothetical protein